jgi:hypothetical protein
LSIHTKFQVSQAKVELSSHSGLALLGDLLHACEFKKQVDKVHLLRRPNPELRHGEVLGAMTALLFLGKPDYDAVKPFHDDLLLRKALGLPRVPSAETLRDRLDKAEHLFDDVVRNLSTDIVRRFGNPTPCHDDFVPLDIDVTLFDNSDSHKEGVSRTYRNIDGYAPIFAYLGVEGYLVNAELREGRTHSQNQGDRFLDESLTRARQVTDAPLLVRMDSAHDALDNIKVCIRRRADWIIKRNLRNEEPQAWLETAQERGVCSQPRPGKTVWTGSYETERDNLTLRLVFEVIERTIDRRGQMLLMPELEVNTWWTSLGLDEATVIQLYHAHGTCEQFHSELKTDLDLERLPSGKFATNNLILLLGMFAYNALRLIGQSSLDYPGPYRKEATRRRIRTVLQDIVYLACRVIMHARQWILSFGQNSRWYPVWAGLHAKFT